MRIRLTVHGVDTLVHDVAIDAPAGATLGSVRDALVRAGGVEDDGADATVWSGHRALPDAALLGGPGLREGAVVHVARAGSPTPPPAVLNLDVVTGPNAGLSIPLARGVLTVGRGPDCDLRLRDADVSRHHAELAVTSAGVSVRDLDSTNGTVLIADDGHDHQAVDRDGERFTVGRYLRLGDTVLHLSPGPIPAAVAGLDENGRIPVNRPPRSIEAIETVTLERGEPRRRAAFGSVPWVASLAPAVIGVAMAWLMHSPQFLAFALLSPVMMLSGAAGERWNARRAARRERVEDRAGAERSGVELSRLLTEEARRRRSAHPDPAVVLREAITPGAALWPRRPGDADASEVRLGLADRPSHITVRRGSTCVSAPPVPLVPLTLDLADGSLGLSGPDASVDPVARWVVAQLAAARSPADLRLLVLVDEARAARWRWARWLPHLSQIARNDSERGRVVAELSEQVTAVLDRPGQRAPDNVALHTLVVVDRGRLAARHPGLDRIIADGPRVGMVSVCVEDDARRLPPGCRQLAGATGETGSRLSVRAAPKAGAIAVSDVIADQVEPGWADLLARGLAPLCDPSTAATASVPDKVRLLDLLQRDAVAVDGLDPVCLSEVWATAGDGATFPVGIGTDGPVELDLVRDGPHTLVAGTTGSGKSEFLQTLVAGLAARHPPELVSFVLVDYKGGAAFADCAHLPHVAGLVTDLDAHLTRRALVSLNAELRRRETLFAAAGAVDLASYRAGDGGDPLPRLVIVVDEFAALAEELPDFVTGLVGVAQRGRSLGVHLVLATQRPGGVVSAEIRANTALRVALRVTDPAESQDVVGCDTAAALDPSQPGRAVIRTGERTTLVQSARVGGAALSGPGPEVRVRRLTPWGEQMPDEQDGPTAKTDLRLMVEAIRETALRAPRPPIARPWLPPLPALVTARRCGGDGSGVLHLGLIDRPDRPDQVPWTWDLRRGGSVLIAGGSRSGRTTAARTLCLLAAAGGPRSTHVYVIDCAGGSLRRLIRAAACGAVVTREDPVAIDRVLHRLREQVAERHARLAELGVGSMPEAAALGHPFPALVLVVEGWAGFTDSCETFDAGAPVEALLGLLSDAAAVGLTVLITGDRTTLSSRVAGLVEQRLVLRMSDPDDYALAGLRPRDVPEVMPPGRAVAAGGEIVQLAVLGDDSAPTAQWSHLPDHPAVDDGGPVVVRSLPVRVLLSELADRPVPMGPDLSGVVLGLGGDAAGPIGLDLRGDARVIVAGAARSGRTSLLRLIGGQTGGRPVVFAGSRRSGLPDCIPGATRVDPADDVSTVLAALDSRDVVLLVDDAEDFLDTAAGEALTDAVRRRPDLAAVVAARADELSLCYRGVAAEVRRARCGVLLNPGPGDGELLGVRLPLARTARPTGRAVLVAGERVLGGGIDPVDLQIALPS